MKREAGNRLLNLVIPFPGVDNGWVTFAYWEDGGSKPMSYFSTQWIVPSPPETKAGQTIFIFNGLTPDTSGSILQPVLQWGPSAAGGDRYWAIADWYVLGDSTSFIDDLIPVNSGDTLTGLMTLLSNSNNKYNYKSAFLNKDSTSGLEVDSTPLLNFAFQTLEVYNIANCYEYPADTAVRMTNIEIETDNVYPATYWDTISFITDYGQKTKLVSTSSHDGEVDIYFHKSCNTTGVKALAAPAHEISLYPNPASEEVTVILPADIAPTNATIEIWNLQVQLIKTIAANSKEVNLSISDFAKGMYFVKVKTPGSITVKKLIKE